MLPFETFTRLIAWKSNISMPYLILTIPLLLPLAGCTGEGAGGPIISSLSTPTDATAGVDSDQDPHSEEANHGDGDEDPIIMMTSAPTGVTARLTWDPPSGIDVAGYDIYYGKHSPAAVSSEESESEDVSSEEPLSCSRGEKQAVDGPQATITGLEPDTQYFFAIRAFNDSESEGLCSNEIMMVTPPAQT